MEPNVVLLVSFVCHNGKHDELEKKRKIGKLRNNQSHILRDLWCFTTFSQLNNTKANAMNVEFEKLSELMELG